MAKLPEIDVAPVQESSSSYGLVNAAQQQSAQVFEHGLHAFGTELIKSQNARASADLLRGLEDTSLELRSRKTMSTQEVRDALGPAYDALPPEIRAQTVKRVPNPDTGEIEEQERDDVPTFSVAGHIYDEKARKLLGKAAANFSSPGWAAEFQDHAQHEIIQQKMLLSRHQMYDMHDYLQTQDTTTAVDLANTGRYAEARQVINGSRTMDLAHKTQMNEHIDKIEQVRPLYESLRTGDIATMAKQMVQLGDEKQFTKLKPEERLSFTNRMEAEIKQFQDGIRRAEDTQLKANAEAGWNGIFGKERAGQPVSYRDIPMPGTVHADSQKAMIEYVDKLNKGEKPETDWTLYAGLLETSRDRTKFSNVNLLNYRGRLADSEFKQLLELQQGMKGGNPDAYDHFITTDEAIDYQLRGAPYKLDPKDKDKAEQIGFVKTQVQKALAREQEAKGGKALSLDERDTIITNTLKDQLDPRKHTILGMTPFLGDNKPTTIPAMEAGVPANVATIFRRAVTALNIDGMRGSAKQQTKALEGQYKDYTYYEPMIETAWQAQRGANISPGDAVQVWYHLKQNWGRLEGALRAGGGWTDHEGTRKERMVNLAVQEALRQAGN